jgi:hypothetical protein
VALSLGLAATAGFSSTGVAGTNAGVEPLRAEPAGSALIAGAAAAPLLA